MVDKRLDVPPYPYWDDCDHEWRDDGDYERGGGRTDVICRKCKAPGEKYDETGDVCWPAT